MYSQIAIKSLLKDRKASMKDVPSSVVSFMHSSKIVLEVVLCILVWLLFDDETNSTEKSVSGNLSLARSSL
jgi:hypothetical protein